VFGLAPSARFCSATFFCARKNASHFSLSGAKKTSVTAKTLGEMLAELVGIYKGNKFMNKLYDS
jgi:hypothetical protein